MRLSQCHDTQLVYTLTHGAGAHMRLSQCHDTQLVYTLTHGAGSRMRLSQCHDTQLHKNMCSCTDFTICTVLNYLYVHPYFRS